MSKHCDECDPSFSCFGVGGEQCRKKPLTDDYLCTCLTHGCSRGDGSDHGIDGPCQGQCGCAGCRRAYCDAMDGPD
jgi:hypothetical protein